MSSTSIWSCKRSKTSVRNIYKNTEYRKEFDCTMCTVLEFIPEWLFTMLPFENERNASIFLQSRKILLHPNVHLSTCTWAMGLSYYMEMGKERPKLPLDRLCSFQAPCWKAEVLFNALWWPFALSQSSLLQQSSVHLSSLPCCKKKFSMVMLRLQCIHFLVLLPSSTLGFLLQELSRDH